MSFIKGIVYNLKGLVMGLTTPRLLFLGMLRLAAVVVLTMICSAILILWHEEILGFIWLKPSAGWLIVVWKIASFLLSLFLAALSGLFSYIVAQMLFAVFIMDYMSRITEGIIRGRGSVSQEHHLSLFRLFLYLIGQEIPRAVIPLFLMILIMGIGFMTPLGPVVAVVTSLAAVAFLAWDNTDLVPARRMVSFGERFLFFKKNILFHLGFGICFMVPWVNILFLSFAPVGATLYFLENERI